MAVNTDAIRTILNAYNQGYETSSNERLRNEASARQQEQLKLEQKRLDQQIKREDDRFKLAIDSFELQKRAQEQEAKNRLLDRITAGKVPIPIDSPELGLHELPQNQAAMRPDITVDGITARSNEYVTPQDFMQNNPEIVSKRQAAEQKFLADQALRQFNAETANQRQLQQQAFQAEQNAMNRNARMAAAQIRASNSDATGRDRHKLSQLKEVDRIAREAVGNNKVIQNYIVSDDAYNHVKNLSDPNYARKNNMSPGVADLEFLYAFAKAQDPNRVTEGEMELLKSATSDLEKLGFKIKGINKDKAFISDTVRKAAFDSIKRKRDQTFGRYGALIKSQYERAKKFDPELTKPEFESMVKLEGGSFFTPMSEGSSSDAGIIQLSPEQEADLRSRGVIK